MKLSLDNFNKARKYLMTHGRELEQRLFEFHFEGRSSESVLNALRKHQNEDGGFERMGEGDEFNSSPMGSSVAFQYINEVGASVSEELVSQGVRYIINSYDHELQYWHQHSEKQVVDYITGKGCANASAELVGYLHKYSELVPKEFLMSVTERAMSILRNLEDPLDCFETLCFLRMAENVTEPNKSEIINRIKEGISQVIETNPGKWSHYCAKPWWFAPSPKSPLFKTIEEHVIRSLEHEIQTQSDEGNFILNWQITGKWEQNWKSIWTMDALRVLDNYSLIER
jgi:hypothetical protein